MNIQLNYKLSNGNYDEMYFVPVRGQYILFNINNGLKSNSQHFNSIHIDFVSSNIQDAVSEVKNRIPSNMRNFRLSALPSPYSNAFTSTDVLTDQIIRINDRFFLYWSPIIIKISRNLGQNWEIIYNRQDSNVTTKITILRLLNDSNHLGSNSASYILLGQSQTNTNVLYIKRIYMYSIGNIQIEDWKPLPSSITLNTFVHLFENDGYVWIFNRVSSTVSIYRCQSNSFWRSYYNQFNQWELYTTLQQSYNGGITSQLYKDDLFIFMWLGKIYIVDTWHNKLIGISYDNHGSQGVVYREVDLIAPIYTPQQLIEQDGYLLINYKVSPWCVDTIDINIQDYPFSGGTSAKLTRHNPKIDGHTEPFILYCVYYKQQIATKWSDNVTNKLDAQYWTNIGTLESWIDSSTGASWLGNFIEDLIDAPQSLDYSYRTIYTSEHYYYPIIFNNYPNHNNFIALTAQGISVIYNVYDWSGGISTRGITMGIPYTPLSYPYSISFENIIHGYKDCVCGIRRTYYSNECNFYITRNLVWWETSFIDIVVSSTHYNYFRDICYYRGYYFLVAYQSSKMGIFWINPQNYPIDGKAEWNSQIFNMNTSNSLPSKFVKTQSKLYLIYASSTKGTNYGYVEIDLGTNVLTSSNFTHYSYFLPSFGSLTINMKEIVELPNTDDIIISLQGVSNKQNLYSIKNKTILFANQAVVFEGVMSNIRKGQVCFHQSNYGQYTFWYIYSFSVYTSNILTLSSGNEPMRLINNKETNINGYEIYNSRYLTVEWISNKIIPCIQYTNEGQRWENKNRGDNIKTGYSDIFDSDFKYPYFGIDTPSNVYYLSSLGLCCGDTSFFLYYTYTHTDMAIHNAPLLPADGFQRS